MRPVGVLWDVGNVIVPWDPVTLYDKIFEEPAARDRFLSDVCTIAWHQAHDRGVSFTDNRRPLLDAFPEHADHILAWDTRFMEMCSPVVAETEAAMHALAAKGIPQFALTNMPSEKWADIQALSPAFGHLKDTIVSGDEKLVKPDPAIFHLASRRARLEPGQMLFIDDLSHNIAAAAGVGFHVHHFTDPAALRPALESHGLL